MGVIMLTCSKSEVNAKYKFNLIWSLNVTPLSQVRQFSQAYSIKWVWGESNSSKSYSNTLPPQIKSTPLDKKIENKYSVSRHYFSISA